MPRRTLLLSALLCLLASFGFDECEAPVHFVFIDGPETATFTEAQTVTITATAVKQDGLTVKEVRFLLDGREVGSDSAAPYTYRWNITDEHKGTYRFHAEADYTWPGGGETLRSEEVVYEVVIDDAPVSPTLVGSVPGSAGGFRNRGVAVSGNLALVTGSPTAPDDTWLKVIDVANPSTPRIVGSLGSASLGARDVTFDGQFAYLLRWVGSVGSGQTEFAVVDVRSPSNPVVASTIPLGGLALGKKGLALAGSTAYAVDQAGLHLIDVSNPFSPRVLSSVGLPNPPRDVAVLGDLAYVAGGKDRVVVDVRDPRRPVVVSSKRTPPLWSIEATQRYLYLMESNGLTVRDRTDAGFVDVLHSPFNAESLAVDGSRAFLSSHTSNEVAIVDISDPANLAVLDTVATPGRVNSLAAEGPYLFAGDDASTLDIIRFAR